MKNESVWLSIKKAAHTWAKANNMTDYLTSELIENLRMAFIAGTESRPPLQIRHTRTFAEMSEVE
jgi:hypothetical protein